MVIRLSDVLFTVVLTPSSCLPVLFIYLFFLGSPARHFSSILTVQYLTDLSFVVPCLLFPGALLFHCCVHPAVCVAAALILKKQKTKNKNQVILMYFLNIWLRSATTRRFYSSSKQSKKLFPNVQFFFSEQNCPPSSLPLFGLLFLNNNCVKALKSKSSFTINQTRNSITWKY